MTICDNWLSCSVYFGIKTFPLKQNSITKLSEIYLFLYSITNAVKQNASWLFESFTRSKVVHPIRFLFLWMIRTNGISRDLSLRWPTHIAQPLFNTISEPHRATCKCTEVKLCFIDFINDEVSADIKEHGLLIQSELKSGIVYIFVCQCLWTETHLKLKSRVISSVHNISVINPIVLKFCTEHGNIYAVLSVVVQTNWTLIFIIKVVWWRRFDWFSSARGCWIHRNCKTEIS